MNKIYRRHVRERVIVEHVAGKLYEIKRETGRYPLGSRTETGLSVEDQIRKVWEPYKGGGPPFLL